MLLPPGLLIRAATPGDAPFIQRVHQESIRGLGPRWYSRAEVESWAAGLSPVRYVTAMDQDGESFLIAEPPRSGGRLAAFCSFGGDRIHGLYTHPDWSRQGVGAALLARAEAAIRAAGDEEIHLTSSLPGLAFYEKHGYRAWRRRGFWTRGGLVLAVVEMAKRIPR